MNLLPFSKKLSPPGFERTYPGAQRKIKKWQPRGISMAGLYSRSPGSIAPPKKINNNIDRFYIRIRIDFYNIFEYNRRIIEL